MDSPVLSSEYISWRNIYNVDAVLCCIVLIFLTSITLRVAPTDLTIDTDCHSNEHVLFCVQALKIPEIYQLLFISGIN